MGINPFFLLLYVLIFIPQLVAFHSFPFKGILLVLTLFLVFAIIFKTSRWKKVIRNTLLGVSLVLIALQWVKSFSINNLPFLLFLVSDWFILFLLFKPSEFRKYLYISLLSFLNMTLLSVGFNSLLYGVVLFLYLFLVEYFFLLLTAEAYKSPNPRLFKSLFKYSVVSYLFVFLIGVVLFFVLPRPQYPLFALLQRNTANPIVGFSSDIKLGAFSKIATDNSVVFRIKVKGLPDNTNPYWRGNTLEIFLNDAWYSANVPYMGKVEYGGKTYREEILVSPYGGVNLFSLGYPYEVLKSTIPVKVDRTKGILLAERFLTSPARVSFLASSLQRGKLVNKRLLLKYPKRLKPIFEKIAKKYSLKGKSFQWVLKGLGKFFSHFRYSLTNRAENLEEFLTVYREGNCEYFASAAALLFRYLGYPSRVVVGFYGGEYNPITKYWVVRQRDAHAWVEVYYHRRWFTFDATTFAISESSTSEAGNLEKNKLLLWWDTLNTYWLNYVINLNRKKQKEIFTNIVKIVKNFHLEVDFRSFWWLPLLGLALAFLILWRKILLILYSLWLFARFKIPFKVYGSFVELYNHLWRFYPEIWRKERGKLKKLIRLGG